MVIVFAPIRIWQPANPFQMAVAFMAFFYEGAHPNHVSKSWNDPPSKQGLCAPERSSKLPRFFVFPPRSVAITVRLDCAWHGGFWKLGWKGQRWMDTPLNKVTWPLAGKWPFFNRKYDWLRWWGFPASHVSFQGENYQLIIFRIMIQTWGQPPGVVTTRMGSQGKPTHLPKIASWEGGTTQIQTYQVLVNEPKPAQHL